MIFSYFFVANGVIADNRDNSVSVDGSSTINNGLNSLNSIYSGNESIYLNENNYNGNYNVNITLTNRNVIIMGNKSTMINGSNMNWIFNVFGPINPY